MSASAVAANDGYLIASSGDAGLEGCSSGTTVAPRITLLRWAPKALTVVWEMFTQGNVFQVKLVPRPNGYWLLWRAGLGTAGIEAVALDPDGLQVAPPTTLVPFGATIGPFAATALGSGLAIAYPVLLDFDAVIDVFAESGIKLFDLTTPDPSPPPYGLMGSPKGEHLLLSFAAANAQGEMRARVARFCLPLGP